MAEEIGIVMSLYDKVSPTLKSIGNNTKAFDKNLQELEQACKAYEKSQESLNKDISTLKSKLAESSDKVREATNAWRDNRSELTKGMLDKAIEEQQEYKAKLKDTESALNSQRKAIMNLSNETRKVENSQGSGSSGKDGLGKKLMAAGLFQMFSGSVFGIANTLLSSTIGEPDARLVSSTMSGIFSGAAAGAIAGPVGAAVGAAIGGLSGIISGKNEILQAQDDVFKSYNQEQFSSLQEKRASELTGGSAIAAGRETDLTSFTTILGSRGQAESYLEQVKTLANTTPFLYDDLTGLSKTLLTFGTAVEDIIPTLTAVGDAGAAMGMGTDGIGAVATALGRMQSSDKVSLEWMSQLTDRGISALNWLAEKDGITVAQVYDKISKGSYSGKDVASFIIGKLNEEYGGAMEDQSKTYSGLTSTLEGWKQEMQDALGSAYNETGAIGLNADIAFYEGDAGAALEQMNTYIGEGKALADNLAGQYQREAMSVLLLGGTTTLYDPEQEKRLQQMHEDYIGLQEKYKSGNDQEKAIISEQMNGLKNEAESMAESAYTVSDAAKGIQEAERDQISAIRDNTVALEAWKAKYEMSQEESKGMGTGIFAVLGGAGEQAFGEGMYAKDPEAYMGLTAPDAMYWGPKAFGMNRVPYDNFPAMLHEGERVLTAQQSRQADAGGGAPVVQVTVTGNSFYGSDQAMEERVARKVGMEVQRAILLAQP